jgi:type IV pilus assembly protein PilA
LPWHTGCIYVFAKITNGSKFNSTTLEIQMKKVQAGFTLIELMIVVAIIGILAAIAIPQYQTYIAKSQVTRAMGEAGSIKTAVETCVLNGKLVVPGAAPTLDTHCDPQATASTILVGGQQAGAPAAVVGSNGYPQVLTPLTGNGGDTIIATFGSLAAGALQNPAGQTLTWTRNAAGTWSCASTVLQKYKPVGC